VQGDAGGSFGDRGDRRTVLTLEVPASLRLWSLLEIDRFMVFFFAQPDKVQRSAFLQEAIQTRGSDAPQANEMAKPEWLRGWEAEWRNC
jgi:hypothetical protein